MDRTMADPNVIAAILASRQKPLRTQLDEVNENPRGEFDPPVIENQPHSTTRNIRDSIAGLLGGDDPNATNFDLADKIMTLGAFTPGIGNALLGIDTAQALKDGNNTKAAALAAMQALPLGVAKGLKHFAGKADDAINSVRTVPNSPAPPAPQPKTSSPKLLDDLGKNINEFDADQAQSVSEIARVKDLTRGDQLNNLFHGTPAGFSGKIKPRTADAVFLTPDRNLANQFAKPTGFRETGAVMPAKANGNFFDFKNPEHVAALAKSRNLNDLEVKALKNGDWTLLEEPASQAFLRSRGFDGWWAKERGAESLGVFNRNTVTSPLTGETLFSGAPATAAAALAAATLNREEN